MLAIFCIKIVSFGAGALASSGTFRILCSLHRRILVVLSVFQQDD